MKRVRIFLWVIAAVALAGFLYLLFWPPYTVSQSTVPAQQVSLGGPFTLVDSAGQPFPSSELAGKPYAIFFGFTHCPHVCPTTLARLVRLREQLGRGDESFEIVFVTVDPERDGPEQVGTYAKAFDEQIIALTGSPQQIDKIKKQFGIFAKKVPEEGGGYTVDHTATVLLFDRSGKFDSTIAQDEQDPAALAKLKRLTA